MGLAILIGITKTLKCSLSIRGTRLDGVPVGIEDGGHAALADVHLRLDAQVLEPHLHRRRLHAHPAHDTRTLSFLVSRPAHVVEIGILSR